VTKNTPKLVQARFESEKTREGKASDQPSTRNLFRNQPRNLLLVLLYPPQQLSSQLSEGFNLMLPTTSFSHFIEWGFWDTGLYFSATSIYKMNGTLKTASQL
jgi:hypothetical protein